MMANPARGTTSAPQDSIPRMKMIDVTMLLTKRVAGGLRLYYTDIELESGTAGSISRSIRVRCKTRSIDHNTQCTEQDKRDGVLNLKCFCILC